MNTTDYNLPENQVGVVRKNRTAKNEETPFYLNSNFTFVEFPFLNEYHHNCNLGDLERNAGVSTPVEESHLQNDAARG